MMCFQSVCLSVGSRVAFLDIRLRIMQADAHRGREEASEDGRGSDAGKLLKNPLEGRGVKRCISGARVTLLIFLHKFHFFLSRGPGLYFNSSAQHGVCCSV